MIFTDRKFASLTNCFLFLILSTTGITTISGQSFSAPSFDQPQSLLKSAIATDSDQIRNGFWSFGLGGNKHFLKGGDGNELLGNAVEVSIGTGYIRHKWYSYGSFNIFLGPYEPTREKQLNVDYSGTGFTYWWGYSAQELDLRSPDGGYGFTMGLQYSDLSGRSFGRNRQEQGTPNSPDNIGLINDYTMRTTNFSIVPGIFFCWLEKGRPRGNTPKLLRTRIEGYLLTLGFAFPVVSTYRARFTKKLRDDSTGGGEISDVSQNEPGRFKGYSLIINFTSLLGV